MKTLKGITWNHTRGYAPLVVTAKIWNDFHPNVEIQWEVRSLWSFGEERLENLVKDYDLLLIDHPFIGTAAKLGLFIPFDKYLTINELDTFKQDSVGFSHKSYEYNGHQWALAVDTAAQVSVARIDLFKKQNLALPKSWEEVIALAKETGKVAMPLAPMGLLGSFFTLYANQFGNPFTPEDTWNIERGKGVQVLNQLKNLFQLIDKDFITKYPVELLNSMAQTNDILYMPICYGYANYGMEGYAKNKLSFGALPSENTEGGTLGGVGIAVSAHSQHIETAVEYCSWIAGRECQNTVYALSGGQPAVKSAWQNPLLNRLTNNFYKNTLETVEKAFVRPRFDGFHHFQTQAAGMLKDYLLNGSKPETVIETMKNIFK